MAQQQQQAEQVPPTDALHGVEAIDTDEQLSLAEMSRIMDVAATLRKERALVERQLNIDEVKAELRRRLIDAAELSGETITEAEVDAAVEQYYDRLHTFQPPRPGFNTLLAHLYVRRTQFALWAVGIAAAVAAFWAFSLVGFISTIDLPNNRPSLAALDNDAPRGAIAAW